MFQAEIHDFVIDYWSETGIALVNPSAGEDVDLSDPKAAAPSTAQITSSLKTLSGRTDITPTQEAMFKTYFWRYLCNFDNKKYKDILSDARKVSTDDGTPATTEVWGFDNAIMTDGYSVCFQVSPQFEEVKSFAKNAGVKAKRKRDKFEKAALRKEEKKPTPEEIWDRQEFPHVADPRVPIDTAAKELSNDPGKSDISTVSDGVHVIRYTKRQRDIDTKRTARERDSLGARRSFVMRWQRDRGTVGPQGPSVEHHESNVLGLHNSKSCVFANFMAYFRAHEEYRPRARECYRRPLFRQTRFFVYCKAKSSEQKFFARMLQFFEDVSPKPPDVWLQQCKDPNPQLKYLVEEADKPPPLWMVQCMDTNPRVKRMLENAAKPMTSKTRVVIFYGDWGKNPNLRGNAPTPGIGHRRRMAKHPRISTITTPEHNTSKTCPCCRTLTLTNPNLFALPHSMNRRVPEKHHLLRCSNETCQCRWWNRNTVGAFNIHYKALDAIDANRRLDVGN
jgi:hypothetical protein